ncbi:hypothetical protein JB92DRAFT_3114213 [Gautieria morchelliformis]|nr:hypothetical protein JB92DRAFT_3114213 [Gautieria morchelliformis]
MFGKALGEALNAGHPPISLSVVPSHPQAYGHSEPKIVIEENIYYVPLTANQVAIDSFIVHAGHLYMFQFVSGSQQSVNHGLVAILAQFSNLPPAENQHYIFVVLKDCTKFSCPHSGNGFLADHGPYVAQVG